MHFDYLIVGGGSAGCVLATRLSAHRSNRVLLCEAGSDMPTGRAARHILDSRSGLAARNRRYLWHDLTVDTVADADGYPARRFYEQGRVLGGGSAINGQLANRGAPADYDEWQQRGADGWGWEDVLPFFRKLEFDTDFQGELHGQDGPVTIRRIFPEKWPGHANAVAESLRQSGFKYLEDQNGPFQDGYFPLAISNAAERRVSAATAYLTDAVRRRPNLHIMTGTHVNQLIFEGKTCVGVRAANRGRVLEFRARTVILSCGAIYSPAHLLRAGIGPAAELRKLGIPVIADAPGVGRGLTDHPALSIGAFIKPHARVNRHSRRSLFLGLRFSSGLDGAPPGDLAMTASTKTAWHALGDRFASMTVWLNKTYSETGTVTLTSADWRAHPRVNLDLLSDARDMTRLQRGFRMMAVWSVSPVLQAAISDLFPATYSNRVRRFSQYTMANRLLTGAAALMLDGPPALRRALIRRFIMESADLDSVLLDQNALDNFARRACFSVWHASCSCRMGASGDPNAVTDKMGRVRGVQGLQVVDASIFPSLPRANTNIPTIMVAEKIADQMLRADAVQPAKVPEAAMLQ